MRKTVPRRTSLFQFIAANYHESGDQYRSEYEQINRLRLVGGRRGTNSVERFSPLQNAINATADQSGLSTLKRYFCQLQLLHNRFPMYAEGECAVKFTWYESSRDVFRHTLV